ncbi:salt stress protein, Slr1339 family [Tolypothrix sp. VBCCA 56010]|uniref:salt stress protein, Slr1339 family n=1 Tax=Tolypothrix sp. VBCCA 56010 TaxID=3137731 RepID=UPI003D7DFF72
MDSIDKLLAELKAEYDEPAKPQQPPQTKTFIQPPPKSTSLIDSLLAEVKADFVEKDAAQELRRQQELEQERIKQEKLKAQQLQALKNQAEDWLKKLDPFSAEGLWFERFAEGYSSKLEAAIEYLQTNE